MSARKKEFEDNVVIYKREPGQSNAPFIFDQFYDKELDWGLNANVFFQELQEKVM